MKKFKLLSLLLIISILACLLPVQALALDSPEVTGTSAILIDADTGDVLFEKNADQIVSPGTLTILMTTLVLGDAVESQSITMDDSVTVSSNFGYNLTDGSYTAGLVAGETLTVSDLLHCAVLATGMDASNVLAEYVGGSTGAFVETMNAKAQALGCANTRFVNANGAEEGGQQTTARDLATITRALAENASIRAAYAMVNYTVPATELAAARSLTTPNSMLDPSSEYYYEGAYGFRNALLADGGYAMVAAATYDEMDVIAVVLGCPDIASRYTDAHTMLKWAFDNYSYRQILNDTDTIDSISVEMGDPGTVNVRGSDPVSLLLPKEQQLGNVEYKITYQHEQENTALSAPVEAGQYLGEVTVYLDGVELGTSRVVAANTVDISRLNYLHSELDGMIHNESVRQLVKVLVIALGVYLLLVLFYLLQRLLHLHSLRRARKDRAIARAQQEVEWLDIPQEQQTDASIGYFQDGAQDYPEEYDDEGGYPPEEYDGDNGQPYADEEEYEDGDYDDSEH